MFQFCSHYTYCSARSKCELYTMNLVAALLLKFFLFHWWKVTDRQLSPTGFIYVFLLFAKNSIENTVITARKHSCGKVMFSQVSVCHSVQRRGGGTSHASWDRSPPGHQTWDLPPPPATDILFKLDNLRTYIPSHWYGHLVDRQASGRQAGGTHPTGMLSCFIFQRL